MLHIYSDRAHYIPDKRNYLVPLLRPFWKEGSLTLEERIATYGTFVNDIKMVDEPRKADICVLPMSWQYYLLTNTLDQALNFLKEAKEHDKLIVVYNVGDYSAVIPSANAFIFAANGYQSTRKPRQFALPPFFQDPLTEIKDERLPLRPYQPKPVVGFCGQANDTWVQQVAKPVSLLLKNLQYRLGLTPFEPHPLYPPTKLRARVLDLLEKDDRIETHFIRRQRYRGGQEKPANVLRQEFLQNILDTDYTVCVRGTANYSQRLYETLALGRIPIFVNTDCILPFDWEISWQTYCVWVEESELTLLPEKVDAFHASLDGKSFHELQQRCRQLWEERLSLAGFHAHFGDHFKTAMKKSTADLIVNGNTQD